MEPWIDFLGGEDFIKRFREKLEGNRKVKK